MNEYLFGIAFIPKHGNPEEYQAKVKQAVSKGGIITLRVLEAQGLLVTRHKNSLMIYNHNSPLVQAKLLISETQAEAEAERLEKREASQHLLNSVFERELKPLKDFEGILFL